MATMNVRINESLALFKAEITQYQDEQYMISIYLTDPEFQGRRKRVSGAILFAVLVSISNFAASGYNIFSTNYRLNGFEQRLALMADKVQLLESNLLTFHENSELLFEKNNFLGLRQSVLLNHVDTIKQIHACNIVDLRLDSMIQNLEDELSSVIDSLSSKRLTHKLIKREILYEITKQPLFKNTIYRIAPSVLYDYARTEFVSFRNNKLTLLVNFPIITDDIRFNIFSISESPKFVGRMELDELNNFMSPKHLSIDEVVSNASVIRSTRHCLRHPKFTACPDVSFSTKCVASILTENDVENVCPIIQSDSRITYSKTGALINLSQNERIYDKMSKRNLYSNANGSRMCVFLPQRSGIVFIGTDRKFELFPKNVRTHFQIKPQIKISDRKVSPFVNNLTLPPFSSNRTLTPPMFMPKIDYGFLIGIVTATAVGITFLVNLIVLCFRYRVCTLNANNLF